MRENAAIIIFPFLAMVIFACLIQNEFPTAIAWTAAITFWVAGWWITEPIPIPATSLIPLAVFPLVGVLSPEAVGKSVGHKLVLLMMGGFMLSAAFQSSGLSELLGAQLANIGNLPVLLLIATICFAVTFLTEFTSNTATTILLLPILATAAVAAETDPKIFMIPATISASFAFMLPVATPPNAIVFGSGRLTVKQMAWEGLLLNLFGVCVVTVICYLMFA